MSKKKKIEESEHLPYSDELKNMYDEGLIDLNTYNEVIRTIARNNARLESELAAENQD